MAASAGSAGAQPATYTGSSSPVPPICRAGRNFGAWGSAPRKVRAVTESEGKNTPPISLENLALLLGQ
jgi:hypothetical protein